MRLHAVDLLVVAAYLAAVLALGSWFMHRRTSTREYFRGSGRVPWWAAGLSLYGTGLSAITFIAIPAMAYRTNWAYFVGMFAAIAAVPFVARMFVPFYRDLDITSAYEYLERRFALPVRLLGSLTFIIFHLGRTAIVLVLPALVLSEAVGLNMYTSIAIIGAFSIAYTLLGGIEAVIWTDVMQVIVLIGGAATATAISIMSLDGGLGEFFIVAQNHDKLALYNPGFSFTEATLWVVFLGYGVS
ncbi:MAG: sodium:solute symporter family transporter, partial [Phycisphaeraceae bacterium]